MGGRGRVGASLVDNLVPVGLDGLALELKVNVTEREREESRSATNSKGGKHPTGARKESRGKRQRTEKRRARAKALGKPSPNSSRRLTPSGDGFGGCKESLESSPLILTRSLPSLCDSLCKNIDVESTQSHSLIFSLLPLPLSASSLPPRPTLGLPDVEAQDVRHDEV